MQARMPTFRSSRYRLFRRQVMQATRQEYLYNRGRRRAHMPTYLFCRQATRATAPRCLCSRDHKLFRMPIFRPCLPSPQRRQAMQATAEVFRYIPPALQAHRQIFRSHRLRLPRPVRRQATQAIREEYRQSRFRRQAHMRIFRSRRLRRRLRAHPSLR